MQLASPILFLSLLSAHVRAPCQVLCHTFVACVGGVFRGLQDTRAPLAATIASNIINIILAPVLIFGVSVV